MRNTKLRILTILSGDERYNVRFDLASFVKAAIMYAAHNPDYFRGSLKKEYLERVLKLYGVDRRRIMFTYEASGPKIVVESSKTRGKEYKFDAPYYKKEQCTDGVLRKGIACECEGSKNSSKESLNICKHVAESMIFMADKLGSNDFGVGRLNGVFAKIFRKMSAFDRPLEGYEINEMFYEDGKRLVRILKEDFLTGSERSRFLPSSR